jgi:hypothetical protein
VVAVEKKIRKAIEVITLLIIIFVIVWERNGNSAM